MSDSIPSNLIDDLRAVDINDAYCDELCNKAADEIDRLRALHGKLGAWMQQQWSRIPAVPHNQPGSYDRGYNNGMADILRGLAETLDRAADETTGEQK